MSGPSPASKRGLTTRGDLGGRYRCGVASSTPVCRVRTGAVSVTVDTVKYAAETPDLEQPYAELGLKAEEYARIREILGRRPTSGELAMYSRK